IGKNEVLFGSIVYGGGVISFPVVAYLTYNQLDYFQENNTGLIKVLSLSTLLGLLLMIRFFFPFGVLLVTVPFLFFIFYLMYDILKPNASSL
ncbi:MAG: hypothetical protein AAFW89_07360, partial [Bacteroidota bacterium]